MERAHPEMLEQAWLALGRQLAVSRRAAGMGQLQLAGLTRHSRSTIANVETGRQHARREFFAACDAALGSGTALTRGYDEVIAKAQHTMVAAAIEARQLPAITRRPEGVAAPVQSGDEVARSGMGSDDSLESLRSRFGSLLSLGSLSPAGLEAWDQAVVEAHGRATRHRPPSDLLPDLRADLAELEQVMRGCRAAASLRRLARVTAQLSGLVCLLLVKLGDREGSRRWGVPRGSPRARWGTRLSWPGRWPRKRTGATTAATWMTRSRPRGTLRPSCVRHHAWARFWLRPSKPGLGRSWRLHANPGGAGPGRDGLVDA
jgi:DNA-binding XRE family transcriptional regulator